MGGKWKVHRCDSLSWEFRRFKDSNNKDVLIVEIVSAKMFRKEFLKRIPGLPMRDFGHDLTFIRPIHGLTLHVHNCYVVMTAKAPLRYRLTLQCSSCKREHRGEVTWKFAEDPTKQPEFVQMDD